MALVQQLKKGGRYTKKEQEERKIEVYHLHFEENKSAVKIAELLNVNRNTISEDIHYWHHQLANEFKAQNLTAKLTKQIQRMEIQRDRLLEDLEDVEGFNEKMRLEKFISEADSRLVNLYSKMIVSGKTSLGPTVQLDEISEDEIKEIIRKLIFDEHYKLNQQELLAEIINYIKCELKTAKEIFQKMNQLGLEVCGSYFEYSIRKFSEIRGYVSDEEFKKLSKEKEERQRKLYREHVEEERIWDIEYKEKEKKFIKKYGPQAEWSEYVQAEFLDDNEDE